jgi:HNH endonuclease
MKTLVPFSYLVTAHERRHDPVGYNPYTGFKPWLRDEFVFRCVYCLERELWYPDRSASFSVDHIVPQSENEKLVCVYMNLVYACTRCNSARQDNPVLDPTKVALADHLRLGEDGKLIGLTPDGCDLIELLHLNGNPALKVRRYYLDILSLREAFPKHPVIERIFLGAFAFPDDMPDLRDKHPPEGNTKKNNTRSCYYARRERGELSEIY